MGGERAGADFPARRAQRPLGALSRLGRRRRTAAGDDSAGRIGSRLVGSARLMRLVIIALTLFATGAEAQMLQRVIPRRAPPAPVLLGIDALRADFMAKSGSDKVYFGGD